MDLVVAAAIKQTANRGAVGNVTWLSREAAGCGRM